MITTALRSLNLAAAACAALAAGAVLWLTMQGEAVTVLGWSNGLAAPTVQPVVAQAQAVTLDTSGDLTQLQHAPTISAAQIDAVLARYGSPAAGMGQVFYDEGRKYGINPAVALAFFIHESSAGTLGVAVSTRSVGNIVCAGWAGRCVGRFRAYDSYEAAIEDWYQLVQREYIQGRGFRTVADVIPVYAPATENDVQAYIDAVNGMVAQWAQQAQPAPDSAVHGAPLHGPLIVTQGFGVGTHAPADIWGGVDYAAQTGDPLYAIIDGTAEVSQTWPCGLGLKVKGPMYQTLYCHMSRVDVVSGEHITAGQAVGAAGASGEATASHLHLEVRENGRIIDPTDLVQEVR